MSTIANSVDFSNLKLSVGIDPHSSLLEAWGLPDNPEGLEKFVKTVVLAANEFSPNEICLKPQLSFFERFGSRGLAVLEKIKEFNSASIPVIMDAKRGDIGSTMQGYSDAFLKIGGAFEGSALTLSPYLGPESLNETIDFAAENSKTVFLLCLTSNREAKELQLKVAAQVFEFAKNKNSELAKFSNSRVGLVVGATTANLANEARIDLDEFNGPILVPGIGAQGATFEDVRRDFRNAAKLAIPAQSRSILKAGPEFDSIVEKIATELELAKILK